MQVETIGVEEWPDVVAASLVDHLQSVPDSRICLPTGSTPRPMYRRFAESGGDLSRSTVFLLDEVGLARSSGGRFDEMIQRDLLGLLSVAPRAVHAIDVDAPDMEDECRRYEALVRDGGLDLAVLGLGANGHLGLNEPGSDLTSTTRVVQLTTETSDQMKAYGFDTSTPWGATLGIDTLLSAKRLWLLVTGSHKAEILARTMADEVGPNIPATYLRNHKNVTVFADEAASALLLHDSANSRRSVAGREHISCLPRLEWQQKPAPTRPRTELR
jgi:glucosamine-6-phosphate deaminase